MAEPDAEVLVRRVLLSPEWDLPLPEELVGLVSAGVRRRRAGRRLGVAGGLAVVAALLAVLPGALPGALPGVPAERGGTAPAAPASPGTGAVPGTSAARPLGGWTLGWLPPGYRALSRDGHSTVTAGPDGLLDAADPAVTAPGAPDPGTTATGPGSFPVVVHLRRLTDRPDDVTDLVVTVLSPREGPGRPLPADAPEVAALFAAYSRGAGPAVPVPDVPAGEAVLVPDGTGSGEVVVRTTTGDVVTVSSARLPDEDVVRIARSLHR